MSGDPYQMGYGQFIYSLPAPCPTCGRCPTCGVYRPAPLLFPEILPGLFPSTTAPAYPTVTTIPPAGAGADARLDDHHPTSDSHGDDGRLLDPISYGC